MPSDPVSVEEIQTACVELKINNQVHPRLSLVKLRAAAHLYGLDTVPLEQARILMLDSGIGCHLLPYAIAYPEAEFLGLCQTQEEQSTGTCIIAKLGLDNLHIAAMKLGQLDPEDIGYFDYILAPKLNNTLGSQAAQAILQGCNALLSPLGVLCVAYDIYPGAKATEVVRDAMLMHSASSVNASEIEGLARAALTLFTNGIAYAEPMANSMQSAALALTTRLDTEGAQAVLSEQSKPCYFIEFVSLAAQAGLTCIGDIEPQRDLASVHGTSVAMTNSILGLGQAAALRQQYLDFSTGRTSRHSLLVKSRLNTIAATTIQYERLNDLSWASTLVPAGVPNTDIDTVAFADGIDNRVVLVKSPIVAAMLNALAHVWPGTLSVNELVETAEKSVPCLGSGDDKLRREVLEVLKSWFEDGNDSIQYCLGKGPYDGLRTDSVHIMPSVTFNIAAPVGTPKLAIANLWGQTLHYEFSDVEDKVLLAWQHKIQPEQLTQENITKTLAVDSIGTRANDTAPAWVNTVTPEILARLLSKLRRAGILLADKLTWRDLLFTVIDLSNGEMPLWSEYISSLARCKITQPKTGKEIHQPALPPHVSSQIRKLNSLFRSGNAYLAEPLARQLTSKYPNMSEGWYQLARIQVELKQYAQSLPTHLHALYTGSDEARAYEYLVATFIARGDLWASRAALNRAQELDPKLNQKHFLWGNLFLASNEATTAEAHLRREIELHPENAAGYLNLSNALVLQGNHTAAEEIIRVALKKAASNHALLTQLTHTYLFVLNYNINKSSQEIFSEYLNFDKSICLPHRTSWRSHKNKKSLNRKLKIAYLSPDFNNHAVSKFLEPLIANHDRERFEIFAYANQIKEDAVTQRYKSYVDHWQSVLDMSDDALAARIRTDEIDILVDVAGHTAGNRLSVFARKPAPVSLTWLGYGYTTGLSAIDYFLGDDGLCPPGSESFFSEKIWRLPASNYVYRANWDAIGETGSLPALKSKGITFGTLTRAIRINPLVVETWASILRKLPSSRLVVNSANYADPNVCLDLEARFAEHGIAKERLSLMFQSPPWDSLRTVDIGLDCFPHNSGTTLFDTLCMGIPYVTLAGRPGVGGIGASILNGVGHGEWIAHSRDEYIEKVLELASDLPRLARTRLRLGDELKNSPMMDEPGFARKVEDAYRTMFQKWVESKK